MGSALYTFTQRDPDVLARRLTGRCRVQFGLRDPDGQPGDWLVQHPSGHTQIISDHDFQRDYEPVGDVAKLYVRNLPPLPHKETQTCDADTEPKPHS